MFLPFDCSTDNSGRAKKASVGVKKNAEKASKQGVEHITEGHKLGVEPEVFLPGASFIHSSSPSSSSSKPIKGSV